MFGPGPSEVMEVDMPVLSPPRLSKFARIGDVRSVTEALATESTSGAAGRRHTALGVGAGMGPDWQ